MRTTNKIKHAKDEIGNEIDARIHAVKLLITKLIRRKELLITGGEITLFTEVYQLCTEDSLVTHKEFTGALKQGEIHYHKFGQASMNVDFNDPQEPMSRAFVWWYLTGIIRQAQEQLDEFELQRERHGCAPFRDNPYRPPAPLAVQQAFRSILVGPTN